MENKTLNYKKRFYFDYLHWTINLAIRYKRAGAYPLDYWEQNLKERLTKRNELAINIKAMQAAEKNKK